MPHFGNRNLKPVRSPSTAGVIHNEISLDAAWRSHRPAAVTRVPCSWSCDKLARRARGAITLSVTFGASYMNTDSICESGAKCWNPLPSIGVRYNSRWLSCRHSAINRRPSSERPGQYIFTCFRFCRWTRCANPALVTFVAASSSVFRLERAARCAKPTSVSRVDARRQREVSQAGTPDLQLGRPHSSSLKSAIHNWLEWSSPRLLVHMSLLPSGEKTGSTSAEG
jgi:hypothetical protein